MGQFGRAADHYKQVCHGYLEATFHCIQACALTSTAVHLFFKGTAAQKEFLCAALY